MFGPIVFLPLFLQTVTGASATNSGLLLLPLMVGVMTMSVTSGRIISATGRYVVGGRNGDRGGRDVPTQLMHADTGRLESSASMLVVGIGIGMVMQVLVLVVQNTVAFEDLGVATSATTFFRSMGGSFGVAVFGAIMSNRLAVELPRLLPAGASDAAARGDLRGLLNAPERIRALPDPIADAVVEAVARSVTTVFLWAVPMLAVGFLLSWLLKEIPLRDTVHGGATVEGAGEDVGVAFETAVDPENPPELVRPKRS